MHRLFFVVAILLCLPAGVYAEPATGTVVVAVNRIDLVDDELRESAWSEVGVYLDGNVPYGGPGASAWTNGDGEAVLELTPGTHTVLFAKMTSSHSLFVSEVYEIEVPAQGAVAMEWSFVPFRATVRALGDVGWGNALYITGATELLGNWQTAYKMTWTPDGWVFSKRLPRGLQFKIVRAPWVEGDSISTEQVTWEQGWNRRIEVTELMENVVSPSF